MADEHSTPGKNLAAVLGADALPKTLRGKAQRAIFRLIAGSVGLPYYEKIRENLDTIEGRSRVNAMIAEEVGRQAIADPELMERAKARFIGDLTKKQENLEAIASKTQEKIARASDRDDLESDEDAGPSEDWMNTFSRQAEDASSEELRQRLADVLAGEIQRPGSFSRSTIRLISELDREVLLGFTSALVNRTGHQIIRELAWVSGEGFNNGVLLEDAGLISGSSGLIHHQMLLDSQGNGFLAGDGWGMVAQGTPGLQKQIGVWLLTRAGKEVAQLLAPTDERQAVRRAVDLIDKGGLTRILLGKATRLSNGQVSVAFPEVAWSAEPQVSPPMSQHSP